MSEIKVIRADENRAEHWESFLRQADVHHHAYSWKWKSVFERVFGHRSYYLIAESSDGAVRGILPLVCVKSMLFGRSLISVPYLNAGGVVALDSAAAAALLESAATLAQELQADYCEMRHVQAASFYPPSVPVRTHKVTMQLALPESAEKLFGSFPPKLRSQIRRPSKSGMYAEVSSGAAPSESSLNAFYQVFSEHMRDLGTPVYPKKLFSEVRDAFGPSLRIITVHYEGEPAAAAITIGQGNLTEVPWASALKKFSKHSPNMLLYWEAMKAACDDGYRIFDFGRSSPESGTFRFKQQWGAEPVGLHWYYHASRVSPPDVNPHSPKYRLLVNCWKRLPLSFANTIGPWLTRSIP